MGSPDSYLNEPFRLRLPGIDRLVEFVNKEGSGCHVLKKDLSRAYRHIPVDPGDYHLSKLMSIFIFIQPFRLVFDQQL